MKNDSFNSDIDKINFSNKENKENKPNSVNTTEKNEKVVLTASELSKWIYCPYRYNFELKDINKSESNKNTEKKEHNWKKMINKNLNTPQNN